jgi:hypothetical protein
MRFILIGDLLGNVSCHREMNLGEYGRGYIKRAFDGAQSLVVIFVFLKNHAAPADDIHGRHMQNKAMPSHIHSPWLNC